MNFDIKRVDHWEAPKEDGVPLLTMPNIPLPLHGQPPRVIMGVTAWNKMRKQCYADADYTCQVTGVELGQGHCHAHEVYDIDWANQTATFKRVVCISPRTHTRFIHSGRALTMFERGDKNFPKSPLIATVEESFKLIQEWNEAHPNEEPLRVSPTLLDWLKNPKLQLTMERLIDTYSIKFYDFDMKCFDKKHWSNWKLVYNGEEYPTKFATQADWEEHFKEKKGEQNGNN